MAHPIFADGENRAAIACYTHGRSYFWAASMEEAVKQARRHVRRKGTLCCVFCFEELGAIDLSKIGKRFAGAICRLTVSR